MGHIMFFYLSVHGTDHSRLDLIVPGEQHFYIRASSPQERQEWLVALGSTKASMGKTIEEPGIISIQFYLHWLDMSGYFITTG